MGDPQESQRTLEASEVIQELLLMGQQKDLQVAQLSAIVKKQDVEISSSRQIVDAMVAAHKEESSNGTEPALDPAR